MERIGHVWRVKPGKTEEYAERHRTIWPELARLLRAGGVTSYTIYLRGELVFSHMEVENFDRLVQRLDRDPVAERWEESFSDLIEYPNAEPSGWPERLREVWTL
jgi:L-rhamnose mutarotase